MISGIAQGTVLGPLLFIFYINDVISTISHCKISMFADDCIIYEIGNDFDQMYRKLQSDLDSFIQWCTKNGLKINSDKTKAMITTTKCKCKNLVNIREFKIMGKAVEYVVQYNYLGLLLDNEMTLQPLFKNIKKRISNKLFSLRK